jgi:general stress protein CsbA
MNLYLRNYTYIDKLRFKTHIENRIFLNDNNLTISYKGEIKTFENNTIEFLQLKKVKSKKYYSYMLFLAFLFSLLYYFYFNFYIITIHVFCYVISYLYSNQYEYYFTISAYNNVNLKIKIDNQR